jgi:hypothetical protein
MMAFFHGLGEATHIYDNEFHLLHGGYFFNESVDFGRFDGYILLCKVPVLLVTITTSI